MSKLNKFEAQEWTAKIEGTRFTPEELFNGNTHAYRLTVLLLDLCNIWDDRIDRDAPVSNEDIAREHQIMMLDIPTNPFYATVKAQMDALHAMAMLAYETANIYEEEGELHGLELAHGLRYAIVNVIGYIVYLCCGMDEAKKMWPEFYKACCEDRVHDYIAEISNRGTKDG